MGMHSTLLLLLALQKQKLGFMSLYLFGQEFAPTSHVQLFLSHIVSLYLLSLGEVCSSARFLTLKQRVPDLKPVSLPYSPPGYFIIMH